MSRYPDRVPWRKTRRRAPGRRGEFDDEFERLQLDDRFVRGAAVVELSAEEREARHRPDALLEPWDTEDDWEPPRRKGRWRRVPAVLAIVALVPFLAWKTSRPRPQEAPADITDPGPQRTEYQGELAALPPPTAEEAAAPLGHPPPRGAVSDEYAFMRVRPGSPTPIAYDPCRPIHIVVNARTAPAGAAPVVEEAIDAVRRATGLSFVIDGATDEAPSSQRAPYQPDRYPKRWAPVLVAWSDPAESPVLAGSVAGTGGSVAVHVGDDWLYVTGAVTLDGPQFRQILDGHDGHAEARAIVEHELGHLVGLDHVPYPAELMSPVHARDRQRYGPGDLAGLAVLGQGPCVPGI